MRRAWGTWVAGLGKPDGAAASPTLLPCRQPSARADPHQIPRASGQSRAIPAAVRSGDTGLSKRKWSWGEQSEWARQGWCQGTLSLSQAHVLSPPAGRGPSPPGQGGRRLLVHSPPRTRSWWTPAMCHKPAFPWAGAGTGTRRKSQQGPELLGLCPASSILPWLCRAEQHHEHHGAASLGRGVLVPQGSRARKGGYGAGEGGPAPQTPGVAGQELHRLTSMSCCCSRSVISLRR